MIKPNIFIVGIQKAGTTSLYDTLRNHPEIFGPLIKDYNNSHPFFSDENYYKNKKKKFEKLFSDNNGIKNVITSDVDLIEEKQSLIRIKEYSPNAKIIICLRNPLNRLKSMFKFYKQQGKINEKEILENELKKDSEHYLSRSLYFDKICNAFEIFPKENIKIVLFEEIIDKNKQSEVLDDLYEFLEISKLDTGLLHENKTGVPQNSFARNIYEIGKDTKIRSILVHSIIDKFFNANKRYELKRKLFKKEGSVSSENVVIPEETKNTIINDSKKLKEKFDIDVLNTN